MSQGTVVCACVCVVFIMFSDVGVYQCCEWQTFSLASGSELLWQSVWLHAQIGNPHVPLDVIFISSFNAKWLLLFILCTCNMYWFSLCNIMLLCIAALSGDKRYFVCVTLCRHCSYFCSDKLHFYSYINFCEAAQGCFFGVKLLLQQLFTLNLIFNHHLPRLAIWVRAESLFSQQAFSISCSACTASVGRYGQVYASFCHSFCPLLSSTR